MTGYIIFIAGFVALAVYCLVRGLMARHKALLSSDDNDEERRLAKAYLQRAALCIFIGLSIFLTRIL